MRILYIRKCGRVKLQDANDNAHSIKTCSRCREAKPLDEFGRDAHQVDGKNTRCKSCVRTISAESRVRNPEASREKVRRWVEKNPLAIADYRYRTKDDKRQKNAEWAKKNPEKVAEKSRAYRERNSAKVAMRQRAYREDHKELISGLKKAWNDNNKNKNAAYGAKRRQSAKYSLEAAVRSGVHRGIVAGSKNGRRTFALLGYSIDDLKNHLEPMFHPDMTWGNFGDWHIDHIRPLASFKYSSPDDPDFKAAWALSNLQPLWAAENLSKGSRYEREALAA